jgi:hypothetical protein
LQVLQARGWDSSYAGHVPSTQNGRLSPAVSKK